VIGEQLNMEAREASGMNRKNNAVRMLGGFSR
jgi:hypothetical protein